MYLTQSILIAILGGILPTILWLIFWLREDREHPEPRKRILEAFMAGMACTILVLPLEFLTKKVFGSNMLPLYILWSVIEETFKLTICYFVALRSRDDDEPVDMVIYMIITALGFSALENSLFIFNPLYFHNIFGAFATGNLRFIGATLLHVLSSSIIGIFMAFSFYKNTIHKKVGLLIGLFLAIIVHTLFNVFVAGRTEASQVLIIFSLIWWGIIAVIIIFEKIKVLQPEDPEKLIADATSGSFH